MIHTDYLRPGADDMSVHTPDQPEKPRRGEAEKQRRREYARQYRRENLERVRESERRTRVRRKERAQLEKAQDPEGFRARTRAYSHARYLRDKATPGYEERRAAKSAAAKVRRQSDPAAHARSIASKMKTAHGADHEAMWAAFWNAQKGCCYLCGDPLGPGRETTVDHDHSCCPPARSCSYCRRGLACTRCNKLIGMVGEDAELLHRIASSLEPVVLATRAKVAAKARQGALWSEAS